MNKQRKIEAIAKKELGIETLEEQLRDSLDLHNCGVVSIKQALEAAYEAGRKAA